MVSAPTSFQRWRTALIGPWLVALLLSVTPPAWASNDDDVLQRYFSDMSGMRAKFTQTVSGGGRTHDDQSWGEIFVKRPDHFRLQYSKPYRQLYVADGNRVWSYDEDLAQITVKPQGDLLGNTPAMLLSNPQKLQDSFTVRRLESSSDVAWFELTPREPEANFERVRLAFVNGTLREMELSDSLGQVTTLEFSELVKNPKLDSDLFRFVPPAGVDIIGE
jgi:chaperone LolA